MSTTTDPPQQVAVWYFVGATFVFAAPSLFFADADLWLRLAILAVGFVLVVLGGIRLGKELGARKSWKTQGPPSPEHGEPRQP